MLVAALATTACSNNNNRIAFDGQYFRAKVSKVDKQRDVFTVRVRDVSRSLDGARAAGRYEGIAYCVENYGSSDIDWTVGPETPPEQLTIADDAIVFQGTCPQAQDT
ncbi:hypothetical protein H9Q16_06490 [Sulfitobacter sp. TSTF-M16]|uniref:Uncharacterized protein n=2 Tax=Sulfitobacter aestuariivivens TaxID=2766981 RepID=A0A927HEN6_9RHOB|nr:hypothetical protein [Sulfitobacter aestuariivivens]